MNFMRPTPRRRRAGETRPRPPALTRRRATFDSTIGTRRLTPSLPLLALLLSLYGGGFVAAFAGHGGVVRAQQQQQSSLKAEAGGRLTFVGTIGEGYSVRVTLERRGRQLTGSYYHESDRLAYRDDTGVLYLGGRVDAAGAVTLVERDAPAGTRGARQTATLKARLTRIEDAKRPPRWRLAGDWLRVGGGKNKSVAFVWEEEQFDLGPALRVLSSQPIDAASSAANTKVSARAPQLVAALAGGDDDAVTTARRFNDAARAVVDKMIGDLAETTTPPKPSVGEVGGVTIDGDVTYADARMISVRFVGRRAAQKGRRGVDFLNFDLRLGKSIALTDLFDADAPYRELFAEQSARGFRRSPYRGAVDTSATSPAFGRWHVTPKAIVFTFDAAPGGNTVEAAIPTEMFAGMLGADGPLGLRRRRAPKPSPPPFPNKPVAAERVASGRAAVTRSIRSR